MALLPPLRTVLIGTEKQTSSGLAGTYDGSASTFEVPGLAPGAILESVAATIRTNQGVHAVPVTFGSSSLSLAANLETEVEILPVRSGYAHTGSRSLLERDMSDDVQVGDIIQIGSDRFTITQLLGQGYEVDPALLTSGLVLFSVRRRVPLRGDVLVSFVAKRIDRVRSLMIFRKESENQNPESLLKLVEGALGEATHDNPLSYATWLALMNAASGIVYVSPARGDTITNHQEVLNFLVTQEVYTLAPLTTNADVFHLYREHVHTLSASGKERIVILPAVDVERMVRTSGTGTLASPVYPAAHQTFVDEDGIDFSQYKVKIGDTLRIQDDEVRDILILSVGTQLELEGINPLGTFAYSILSPSYDSTESTYPLQWNQDNFDSERVILVVAKNPLVRERPLRGLFEKRFSFYTCAILAARRAWIMESDESGKGVYPHESQTGYEMAGIYGLDRMEPAVRLQRESEGYTVIHQLSGKDNPRVGQDRTSKIDGEPKDTRLSVRTNQDFINKTIRQEVELSGVQNMGEDRLVRVRIVVALTAHRLKKVLGPGPLARSLHIAVLRESATNPGQVELSIETDLITPSSDTLDAVVVV